MTAMFFHSLNTLIDRLLLVVISIMLIIASGCSSKVEVPVVSREIDPQSSERKTKTSTEHRPSRRDQYQAKTIDPSGAYIVKKSDTLYSIAWRYGHDFKDVAQWNAISAPYTIYPGQKISLVPARQKAKVARKQTQSLQPGPVVSEEYRKQAAKKNSTLQPTPVHQNKSVSDAGEKKSQKVVVAKKIPKIKKPLSNKQIVWRWPTSGKLVKLKQASLKKGIDISGRYGQSIKSSALGRVVYSGSGLLGYGRLIIVKHNETYLSAYAHNSKLLVSEGDDVAAGQTIAEMGNTSSGQSLLHFEIRKNGQSVNPLKLLPKR